MEHPYTVGGYPWSLRRRDATLRNSSFKLKTEVMPNDYIRNNHDMLTCLTLIISLFNLVVRLLLIIIDKNAKKTTTSLPGKV